MNYLVTKKDKFVIFAENGNGFLAKIAVAPLVGAWIEIIIYYAYFTIAYGRSPRGSVD